ncbi:MAG: hypothetical protein V7L01_29490 [Nostoc sp.]|uniref:hypothetical protein n=1 Tax=Nostoc sp. TaxID=1180 RepID=UPI002FFC0EB6
MDEKLQLSCYQLSKLLAYRAIAASACFLAEINISYLRQWLQRIPNLENIGDAWVDVAI